MITNVHRAKASGDIQRYIRYTIAPEKDQKSEHYKHGERTLFIATDNMLSGVELDRNKTSHYITNQILNWNAEKRAGKPQPKSPAVLGVVSFTEKDSEHFYSTSSKGVRYIDNKKVIAIGKEMIGETMGYDRPIFLSAHGDKKCIHIHFAASLVNSQGQIWDGSTMTNDRGEKVKVRDYRRWEMTNEKLEIKYGLDRVEHRKAYEHQGEKRQAQVKRPSNAVVHLANKGEIAPSLDLAGRLELAYNDSNKQFDKFLQLSEKYGINIKPNISTTKVNGLSFSIDGMDNFIKASDFGNKYKWTKLSKELNYEHERDFTKLAELKATARTDIAAVRTNERITTIADKLNEAAAEAARLETASRPEPQHTGYGFEPIQITSGIKTRNSIDQNEPEPGRADPRSEPSKQNSWDDGNGLQRDDEPRRKSRRSRKDYPEDERNELDSRHIDNNGSNSLAALLLQKRANNGHSIANQADSISGAESGSKAVIQSLFDGNEEDIDKVADYIDSNAERDWESELGDLVRTKSQRLPTSSNDLSR